MSRHLLAAAMLLFTQAACERTVRNMYEQPRLDPGEASTLFPDGTASRPPPEGSVAYSMGILAATSSGRRGTDEAAQRDAALAATSAPAPTRELLLRGQQRYTIHCMPCHSPVGDGDGPVVRRGFPAPPSLHEPRLRAATDRRLFDVIGQGHGVMPAFADRMTPQDRWAIVAYIRALQWSQHAEVGELPPDVQAALPPRGQR